MTQGTRRAEEHADMPPWSQRTPLEALQQVWLSPPDCPLVAPAAPCTPRTTGTRIRCRPVLFCVVVQ